MRLLALSLLASLLGCQDYTMNGIEKRQPQMLVHPTEIDFGRLDAGTESGHESFVIVNTGDEDLLIFAPDLVSGNLDDNKGDDLEYLKMITKALFIIFPIKKESSSLASRMQN